MKRIISIAFTTAIVFASCSPANWQFVAEQQGVKVYTNWKQLKKPANSTNTPVMLSFWVENTNNFDVNYDLGAEFFHDTRQIEKMPNMKLCAKAGKSYKGKVNGTYLIPENVSWEMVKDSIVSLEMMSLNVMKVEKCD